MAIDHADIIEGSPLISNARRSYGMAGAVAAGAALAAGELAAGISPGLPSLVSGVATYVIDIVPPVVKDVAILLFGTSDKVALAIGIVVTTVLIGFLAGRFSARTPSVIPMAFIGFGVLGALAAARTPQVDPVAAFANGVIAVFAGLAAYRFVAGPVTRAEQRQTDMDRRVFLGRAGAVVALGLLAAGAGRMLVERSRRIMAGREHVVLPVAAEIAPPVPPGASFPLPDITPIITPNADFYRIDTAPLGPPTVDLSTWKLEITGLVDRPLSLDFIDVTDLPMVERVITIACVSNEVGGDLIGTAKWLGTPLGDLLRRAGVKPEASQIVGRSVDGFTVGFPVEAAFDGREALVVVGMNDEPLPFEHGFPVRLVVAGLYGYVSATKWLSELELTTWDAFDAYWVPRGWSKEGPIKTQSRIDSPRRGSRLVPGPTGVGGVAWAPHRGIQQVEWRVDDGPWAAAVLAESVGDDVWRQWSFVWDAVPGVHAVQVRATDGDGVTQIEQRSPVAPDGATGYHTVTYMVDQT